ncbi:MAG: N-acetyl-gamma-glutamyl-phosphate reductase [Spirochaetaceae bacterium]|jgi:N-acetyl-gamma-glutamyl-phosphate reductase|nr:N-acetyl-gamma-glutamyl-phosphate reductase [Spirochaetaceae bacterium]
MKHTVFVDGQEGTTGLVIHERLAKRDDIEVLKIPAEKRKDLAERKKYINEADIVFLCLPDSAAKESVSLVENPATRVLDCSTAHRTQEGWAYGIPELSSKHRETIAGSKRVSVPGCFATGFNMLMYPLVQEGFVPADYPVSCHAVTGYSGGGRSLIERYEAPENREKLESPAFYALGLQHKHLPEMQKHSGLKSPPLFTPIVADYFRGMTVAVPLHPELFGKKANFPKGSHAAEIAAFFADYYRGQRFVKPLPFNAQDEFEWGFLTEGKCNNTNTLEIMVFGNDQHILAAARLDNLGKGASGAAIQNMNILLGVDEGYGLE